MKITHNNKEYELDAERAIELKVLKPVGITDIKVGDVFDSTKGCSRVVIGQANYHYDYSESRDYRYLMLGFIGLSPFSNRGDTGDKAHYSVFTKQGVVDNLNENGYFYVGNVNSQVAELFKKFKG